MAGLWWITVTMVFCLSAGSLAEIDQKRLATLIYHLTDTVKKEYKINTMYAVAASIPKDPNQVSYDLTKVTTNQQTQWNGDILTTPRLVVATKKEVNINSKKYFEHAEWRVLQNLNFEGQDGDLLVFFSFASPCDEQCANPNGKYTITDGLKTLFTEHEWGAKAFVFEVIFKPGGEDIDPEKTSLALTNIGNSIGSENIFRCYRPVNLRKYICIKCFSGGNIVKDCIS